MCVGERTCFLLPHAAVECGDSTKTLRFVEMKFDSEVKKWTQHREWVWGSVGESIALGN